MHHLLRDVDGREAMHGCEQVGVGAGGTSLGLSFHFAVSQNYSKILSSVF